MSITGNSELAYLDACLLCKNKQSLLACQALIKLYQTRNIDDIKEIIKNDSILLSVCQENCSNINFLQNWVKHYFRSCIYGFMKWELNIDKYSIHKLLYDTTFNYFHG